MNGLHSHTRNLRNPNFNPEQAHVLLNISENYV